MLATFVEGIGEIVLPCSIGMVAPGIAAVLIGWWRSIAAYVVFTFAAAVVAWARAAEIASVDSSVVLGIVVVAAIAVGWAALRSWVGAASTALLLGTFAGSTWQPCVGSRLAEILNGAPAQPASQLLPMLVYVAGVTLLLGALSLAPIVWPKLRIAKPNVAPTLGTGLALVLAVATVTGSYDDVLSDLALLTTR